MALQVSSMVDPVRGNTGQEDELGTCACVCVHISILVSLSRGSTGQSVELGECACVQGFNMAVQQASTQLPETPAELDGLIKDRLNSQLKVKTFSVVNKTVSLVRACMQAICCVCGHTHQPTVT